MYEYGIGALSSFELRQGTDRFALYQQLDTFRDQDLDLSREKKPFSFLSYFFFPSSLVFFCVVYFRPAIFNTEVSPVFFFFFF